MPGESLNGIKSVGKDWRLIGIAVAIGVLNKADLTAADDFGPQASHVVHRDKDRAGPRPGSNRRGVFNQWIAGKQRNLESSRNDERREARLDLPSQSLRPGSVD